MKTLSEGYPKKILIKTINITEASDTNNTPPLYGEIKCLFYIDANGNIIMQNSNTSYSFYGRTPDWKYRISLKGGGTKYMSSGSVYLGARFIKLDYNNRGDLMIRQTLPGQNSGKDILLSGPDMLLSALEVSILRQAQSNYKKDRQESRKQLHDSIYNSRKHKG